MRKPFIAGNWKMNTDSQSSVALAGGVASQIGQVAGEKVDVAVCPPFVYIKAVANAVGASNIAVGAQNVYFKDKGAFTGEISCSMLKDIGCTYAIIGHSERRHVIGETNELINKKVKAALGSGLLPILCVGELLEERQAEKTADIVTEQINAGFEGLNAEQVSAVTIAYEPVWAIGTGLTATPNQAQEVHKIIRDLLAEKFGSEIAEKIRIQYGGSAKPSNTVELMAQEDVDGLLVGGAALKVEDFVEMIEKAG